MPTNGIGSVEDFRRQAEQEAWEAPVKIILPKSGLGVTVRRPRPLAYLLVPHPIPDSVTVKAGIAGSVEAANLSPEERAAMTHAADEVLCAAILEPKFAINPGPEAVDPRWLPDDDKLFLWQWIGGEVSGDGRSLVAFRPEPGPVSGGARGADVPGPNAERDPARNDN